MAKIIEDEIKKSNPISDAEQERRGIYERKENDEKR